MSEEAYYWQHKQDYGVYPDEDGRPDPDMEGYDFRCPKCNEPSFDSEKGSDGLCIKCSAAAANPEHEGASQASGQATPSEERLREALQWALEFVEEPDFFPGAGDRSWWNEKKDGCYSLLRKPGSEVHATQAPSPTPSGEALRERGIKRVSANNTDWMRKALNVFNNSFYTGPTFTGEDIRLHLTKWDLAPPHPNATGALVNALVHKGLIKATGVYVTPKDRSSHARQIKQYVRV